MGDTIWVDVQGRAEGDLPLDNSIMLRLDERLDKLAAKLGVPKLTTFYDYSAKEDEFGDFAEGDEEEEEPTEASASTPRGKWFDPAPALKAVTAIRQHLTRYPADLGFRPDASRSHWPADLMEELEGVQPVLEQALAEGKTFRFLVVG